MERIKNSLLTFQYKGLMAIALVFTLMAAVLFAERSGIQYRYNRLSLELMPQDRIVTKEAALTQTDAACLVLWDSTDADSTDAWEEFQVILTDMKIGYVRMDVAKAFSLDLSQYDTAIVLLSNLSGLGSNLLVLTDWVYGGGSALFPLTLQKEACFSAIAPKLGIREASYENALVESIYVEPAFMIGGGKSFAITDSWNSAMAVQLLDSPNVTVHAHTDDQWRLPLIWESRYGQGKFVVDNFGLCEKGMRGFFAASYSLLEPVCAYPVINASAFYLDDFPSQIPSGNSFYIQRDYGTTIRDFYVNIWWPDMMNFSDIYGIKYTGLAIECYDDKVDGTIDATPDKGTFLNFGNMLLRQCGEIGYHGYNHQPLCFDNCDYKGIYDYKTWESEEAMKRGMDELIDFCDGLFPGVQMSVYVPPSNLLSDEGKAFLLREYPQIRTVSGTYFEEDALAFSCTQEFWVSENGVVDQPRVISGCYVEPFMELAAISELNFHYVNSHFTHPDDALDPDRGAEMGWEALKSHFNEYLSWLYASAPNLRNMTGTEVSAAVQRFAAVTVEKTLREDAVVLTIGNFYDEAQIMLRFNDKAPSTVSGGRLEQLTDSLYLLQADRESVTISFSEGVTQ